MANDPRGAVHTFMNTQKQVEAASKYADMLNQLGSDNQLGTMESVIAQTRLRFQSTTSSAVINTSPEFDEFFVGFLRANAVELAQRTILYASEILSAQQSDAVAELASMNLTPLPVILPPRSFVSYVGFAEQEQLITAYMVAYPATFTLAASSNPLPAGLAMSTSGEITGTPTTAGRTEVTIETTNQYGTVTNKVLFIVLP